MSLSSFNSVLESSAEVDSNTELKEKLNDMSRQVQGMKRVHVLSGAQDDFCCCVSVPYIVDSETQSPRLGHTILMSFVCNYGPRALPWRQDCTNTSVLLLLRPSSLSLLLWSVLLLLRPSSLSLLLQQ